MRHPTSPATPRSRSRRRAWWVATAIGAVTAVVLAAIGVASAATMFSDDFSDGNATGWSKSGGSWSVVTDGSYAYRQSSTSSDAKATAGSAWTDYAVSARVKPLAFNGTDRFVAVAARVQNNTNYYYLALRNAQRVELRKLVGGSSTTLATASLAVAAGTWYLLRLEVVGNTLRGYVNDQQVASATDGTFTAGRIGLATYYASAVFDDIVVGSPTGGTSSPTPATTGPTAPATTGPTVGPQPNVADGFASVNALGQNGTSGGAGGPTITVSTAAEFVDYATRTGPYTIRVNGVITLAAMQNVASDKTIIGVGASSGFTGYGLNVGLAVDNAVTAPPANAVHNVIIRNLNFSGSADDAINVQMYSHHVWIDHNDLSNCYDGLVDIKRGSSYVTVSWNHTHNHTKNMLLGHDDSNAAQDVGYLRVSYHHNWYDRTPQRNPRVRFGEPVHVYNNYYLYNTDVGVACQLNAGCLVEGNYFEDTEVPMTIHYSGSAGRMVERNNVFIGEYDAPDVGGTVVEASTFYSYTLDPAANVKALVMAGSGTGKVTG